ncbi:hypothetical protein ACLOJK_023353 [Asimina triloba]
MGDQLGSSLCDTVGSMEAQDNGERRGLRALQNLQGRDNTLGDRVERVSRWGLCEPSKLPVGGPGGVHMPGCPECTARCDSLSYEQCHALDFLPKKFLSPNYFKEFDHR